MVVVAICASIAIADPVLTGSGDGAFLRQSQQFEGAYASIDQLTGFIGTASATAGSNGQSIKKSCIDEIYAGALSNLAAAKRIRANWATGQSSPDYADRTLQRMVRLQVYAMVFEQEARGCKDMNDASTALRERQAVAASGVVDRFGVDVGQRGGAGIVNPFGNAPEIRLERPPLASPF